MPPRAAVDPVCHLPGQQAKLLILIDPGQLFQQACDDQGLIPAQQRQPLALGPLDHLAADPVSDIGVQPPVVREQSEGADTTADELPPAGNSAAVVVAQPHPIPLTRRRGVGLLGEHRRVLVALKRSAIRTAGDGGGSCGH